MTDVTFDTYAVMTRLTKAGMVEEHAKAIVEVMTEGFQKADKSYARQEAVEHKVKELETTVEHELEGVATREDIFALKEDIVRLEGTIRLIQEEMKTLEMRLTVKMGTIVTAIFAFFKMIDKFL